MDDELGEFLEIAYFQTQQGVDYLIYLITVEGDLSRYDELKALEPNIYPKLKKELRNSQSYVYRQLIILEQDWPALLQVVKKDPSLIVMYEELLFLHYPKEMLQLYQTYVLQLAEKSKNKRNYQQVCKNLEKLKKRMNPDELVEFVKQIQQCYCHKPAFVEELGLFEKSIKLS